MILVEYQLDWMKIAIFFINSTFLCQSYFLLLIPYLLKYIEKMTQDVSKYIGSGEKFLQGPSFKSRFDLMYSVIDPQ